MENIKTLRLATGLTQKAFSQATGIPQRTIEHWEAGNRQPPDYLVKFLAYYLKHENIGGTPA